MFDLFVTGFILVLIGLILAISAFLNSKISRNILQRITFFIVLIFTLVIVVDFELYRNWGFRMNTTPLFFIRYPREAAASTTIWMYLGLFAIFLTLFGSTLYFFKRFFRKSLPQQNVGRSYLAIVFSFIIVLVIFSVRGKLRMDGFGYKSESFRENVLIRHAAINEVWNLGNSIKYTDWCLGQFIRKAKREAWWENTLVILIADHGHRLPGKLIYSEEKSFRIPMLWIGGALQCNDTIISKIGSQTDLATTLLHQLNIDSDSFIFSKNLLTNSQEYAMYVFAEGFGFITPDAMIVRNSNAGVYYYEEGNYLSAKKQGEASFQISQNDFLKR